MSLCFSLYWGYIGIVFLFGLYWGSVFPRFAYRSRYPVIGYLGLEIVVLGGSMFGPFGMFTSHLKWLFWRQGFVLFHDQRFLYQPHLHTPHLQIRPYLTGSVEVGISTLNSKPQTLLGLGGLRPNDVRRLLAQDFRFFSVKQLDPKP